MMYTDDTVINLSSTYTSDIELKLSLNLANLSQWLHYNKLVLNNDLRDKSVMSSEDRLLQSCLKTINWSNYDQAGLGSLCYRRRTHILKVVNECTAKRNPRYLSNYLNVRNRDIHRHKTRNR